MECGKVATGVRFIMATTPATEDFSYIRRRIEELKAEKDKAEADAEAEAAKAYLTETSTAEIPPMGYPYINSHDDYTG